MEAGGTGSTRHGHWTARRCPGNAPPASFVDGPLTGAARLGAAGPLVLAGHFFAALSTESRQLDELLRSLEPNSPAPPIRLRLAPVVDRAAEGIEHWVARDWNCTRRSAVATSAGVASGDGESRSAASTN